MSDNLKDRGPQDRSRVNVNEDWELRYWTKEFGVSEQQLRDAVKKVGVSADAVRKELQQMGYSLRFAERTSGPLNAIFYDWNHGSFWGGRSNYGEDYGIGW